MDPLKTRIRECSLQSSAMAAAQFASLKHDAADKCFRLPASAIDRFAKGGHARMDLKLLI
jgi:hypothetical protein